MSFWKHFINCFKNWKKKSEKIGYNVLCAFEWIQSKLFHMFSFYIIKGIM
jgi:hypothetical protein